MKRVIVCLLVCGIFFGKANFAFAEGTFLKIRTSREGDIYNVFSHQAEKYVFDYQYFRSNGGDYWSVTPGVVWKNSLPFPLLFGLSGRIESNGKESLGPKFSFFKSWKLSERIFSVVAEGSCLVGKDESPFWELFTQATLGKEAGFQYGIQAWLLKQGDIEQVHLSPMRLGWKFKQANYSIAPFVMWRPTYSEEKWDISPLYLGVDFLF